MNVIFAAWLVIAADHPAVIPFASFDECITAKAELQANQYYSPQATCIHGEKPNAK